MFESWSYHCPLCKEGFGDLEGEIIKRKYDGFGDRYTLLRCPRCGELIVTGPYLTCDPYTDEDKEFWGLQSSEAVPPSEGTAK